MVVQFLKVSLPLVLSIFCAFETDEQFYNRPQYDRLLSKASFEMAQHGSVQERSYLNVVIDLHKDGSFKVVKATRIFGEVILRDFQTSDFIYQATSEGTTLAVAFFPEDPFLVRALGDPESAKESTAQAKSAVIVVNIPLGHGSLAVIRKLRLRIFKLLPSTSVSKIDPSIFAELKAKKRLVLINDLPAKTLGRLIAKKLITVRN
jgi:hypothetical protein